MFAAIFDMVYVGLTTNILVAIGALPLVVGLLTTDPSRSWPLLALVTPLCAPGLCAAFAVLSTYSGTRSTTVVRTYTRAWRASWRRATQLGACATAALVVFGVDIRAAWGRTVGAVAIPVLVVLMVLVAATALLTLVVIAEQPGVPLRTAMRACLYLAVRRWYLTAVSLVVLAVLYTFFAAQPALALGLAAAPLLYVVWANSRFTLAAALGPAPRLTPEA
jgi:uncharacterized membrane protein YesL